MLLFSCSINCSISAFPWISLANAWLISQFRYNGASPGKLTQRDTPSRAILFLHGKVVSLMSLSVIVDSQRNGQGMTNAATLVGKQYTTNSFPKTIKRPMTGRLSVLARYGPCNL